MAVSSEVIVTNCCGPIIVKGFTLLIFVECIVSLELLEMRVPAHVALGMRASLSCRWALDPGDVLYSVKWYKDGKEFFRHVPKDHEPHRKFKLPGVYVEQSDSYGSSLVLSEAVSETGGRYRCEVSGERPLFPTVSEHADMAVVVLPKQGPVISGLRSRYRLGDRVQVNCTSGRSRPSNNLTWYINGEPAPACTVLPPIHQTYKDQLETTTLLLVFKLTEQHYKNSTLQVKCLATLANLYWRSNEKSALLEERKVNKRLVPEINLRYHSNASRLLTSFVTSIAIVLSAAFCIRL